MIIDGRLYGQVAALTHPSMDFVFLRHMDRTYIGAVLKRIIFWKFGDILKNGDFGGLGTLRKINRIS